MAPPQSYTIPTRAIITYTTSDWRLQDVLVREPGPHELLVKTVACGVCHTDIANVGGIAPRVLGHEGAGHILKRGESVSDELQINDLVLTSFAHCKECRACRTGHPAHCHEQIPLTIRGQDLNFALAESEGEDERLQPDANGKKRLIPASYFGHSSFAAIALVKESSVVPVKDIIKDPSELKILAPLGCGIQTGACAVVNVARPNVEDSVAVLGLGGVGLSAIMAAKALGVKTIVAVDILPNRLELAKELGANYLINSKELPNKDGLAHAIRSLPPFAIKSGPSAPLGPSAIVDTTGIPSVLQSALTAVDRLGRVVQLANQGPGSFVSVGLPEHMSAGVHLTGLVVIHAGFTLPGSYC